MTIGRSWVTCVSTCVIGLSTLAPTRVEAGPHDLLPTVSMIAVHLDAAAPSTTRSIHVVAQRAAREMAAREQGRPAVLAPMYISFAALQFLDLDSTGKALERGYTEGNPLMAHVVHHRGAAWAVKAATTAVTIVAAEQLWRRKHRKAAVLTMIAANVGYALVVSNNYRKAGR